MHEVFKKYTYGAKIFVFIYLQKSQYKFKKKKGEGILGITVRTVMLNLFDLF